MATLCVSVSLVSLPAVARSSAEALRRFSSGDLQSECDEGEVDPYTGRPTTTSQPKPQNQRPASQGEYLKLTDKKKYKHIFETLSILKSSQLNIFRLTSILYFVYFVKFSFLYSFKILFLL